MHSSYNHAFMMAASLPACAAGVYDCYNDKTCRFCFSHADEYFALELAMGVQIPTCENHADASADLDSTETFNCPRKADIDSWAHSGLLSRVQLSWGHHNLALPTEFSN